MIDTAAFLEFTLNGVTVMLAASFTLVIYRIVRGPELPDRVVALDVLTSVVVGILVVDAIATGQATFLPVGLVLALLAFLGTVAFSYYLQWRARNG